MSNILKSFSLYCEGNCIVTIEISCNSYWLYGLDKFVVLTLKCQWERRITSDSLLPSSNSTCSVLEPKICIFYCLVSNSTTIAISSVIFIETPLIPHNHITDVEEMIGQVYSSHMSLIKIYMYCTYVGNSCTIINFY